jgi:hypothetical protein
MPERALSRVDGVDSMAATRCSMWTKIMLPLAEVGLGLADLLLVWGELEG